MPLTRRLGSLKGHYSDYLCIKTKIHISAKSWNLGSGSLAQPLEKVGRVSKASCSSVISPYGVRVEA